MTKKKECLEDGCAECPDNDICKFKNISLQDIPSELELHIRNHIVKTVASGNGAHLQDVPPELEARLRKYFTKKIKPRDVSANTFSSVDSIVKKVLDEFDQKHNTWNSLSGWQIAPPNDSVDGFAWRLRFLTHFGTHEFTGKDEIMVRKAFEIIACIMYQVIYETCDCSTCKNCILSSRCPLEAKFKK